MHECIDNWILGRYWTPAVTEALRGRAPSWRDWRMCMDGYKEVMESALGEEAAADFYFEAECAEAFCAVYQAPFYVHVGYNILYYAAEHFRTHDAPPNFPTISPCDPDNFATLRARDDSADTDWDEGAFGRDWVPDRTKAEERVERCEHVKLGPCTDVGLRFGLRDLLILVGLDGPTCEDCNATILCACIADDIRQHFGASHGILASYTNKAVTVNNDGGRVTGQQRCLTRCGRGCIGFKAGLCDLCRTDRPAVPKDRGFRNIYSFMHAIRFCLRDEPGIYHVLFDGSQAGKERERQIALASAFVEILRGESTRELRVALDGEPPDVPPVEAFRPYFNKARNLFRTAYGLPGVNEGWVSETQLLMILRELFSGELILDHYRPPWLRGLELDVFLPNRSLAFEYMGIQHYQPVERFGGEKAFKATVERDRLKRELCARRGVRLIDVRYDEPLTIDAVRARCDGS